MKTLCSIEHGEIDFHSVFVCDRRGISEPSPQRLVLSEFGLHIAKCLVYPTH